MRVTNKMMTNNMMRWVAKQSEKLNDAETVVASGKQVNKPSDNPQAASQILLDRANISLYGQYKSNIDLAKTWIETDENTLDAVDTFLEEVQGILSQQSSEELTKDSAIEQLQSIYDQVLDLANTRYGSDYMYSGNQVNTTPFANEVEISGGSPSDIIFGLAADASDLTVEITDSAGEVVRTLDVTGGGTEGVNTIAWDGLDNGGSTLTDGEYAFSIVASNTEGDAVTGYPIYRGDDGSKQVMIGEDSVVMIDRNGEEIFSETLCDLSRMITALQSSDYDPDLISDLNSSMNTAIEQMAAERVALSNIYSQMETVDVRLDQVILTVNDRLTDVETGSDDEAVIKLQSQQTAYEVTLEAAATMLNMRKLSDYL